MNGWLKLYRGITESAVFDDAEVLKMWVYLLCVAAHKEMTCLWRGAIVKVKEGQILTGRQKLVERLNMDGNKVYRALKLLEKLGNIDIEANSRFSLITIKNWQKYQSNSPIVSVSFIPESEQQNNSKITAKRQQNNNRITAEQQPVNNAYIIKEGEELENLLELDSSIKYNNNIIYNSSNKDNNIFVCGQAAEHTKGKKTDVKITRFQKPTVEEVREYCKERKNSVSAEKFYDFYESKGWLVGKSPMKNWKAAVRTWEKEGRVNEQIISHNYTAEEANSSWITDIDSLEF